MSEYEFQSSVGAKNEASPVGLSHIKWVSSTVTGFLLQNDFFLPQQWLLAELQWTDRNTDF